MALLASSVVIANPALDPEESVGLDVNFGAFSTFYYKFEDGIIYDWAKSQFVNSGEYYFRSMVHDVRINLLTVT